MAHLPLDKIRNLAECYGYTEVQYNETSRVIAFVNQAKTARVNVYYTTGTVATCIDHPRSGKTQLFRCDRTLEDLDRIFSNVREHTGAGYHRRDNKGWVPHDQKTPGSRGVECDDARRWRYVHAATGFCNSSQINQIAALCKLFDSLRFEPGGPTFKECHDAMGAEKRQQVEAILGTRNFCCPDADDPNCRCRCSARAGAWCNLMKVIMLVAVNDGVVGVFRSGDIDPNDFFQECNRVQLFTECECSEGKSFGNTYSTMLGKLQRQFRSFPKQIRIELVQWFFDKLMRSDDSFDLFTLSAEFLGQSCSNELLACHREYGAMVYNDKGRKGCDCHGA